MLSEDLIKTGPNEVFTSTKLEKLRALIARCDAFDVSMVITALLILSSILSL